jgi:carboxyl-terminal processing protease
LQSGGALRTVLPVKSASSIIGAWSRGLAAFVFGATIACLGAPALNGAGGRHDGSDGSRATSGSTEDIFRQVLAIIGRDYVDTTNRQRLIEQALRGMASSLDPYSAFLDKGELEEMEASDEGTYCGVGIEVATVGSAVEILSVMDKSPAAGAGLQRKDAIVSVNGQVVGTDIDQTAALLRGVPGTEVQVAVRRAANDPRLYSLRRECLPILSVSSALLEPGYGYVRISTFSDTTPMELNRSIDELERLNHAPLRGLVLDLRDNGGGVLDDGTAVADAFLDRGVIVTADGRTTEAQVYVDATPGDLLHGAPMAVLVNGDSASASEIVAGALRDHARATLVGSRTYGKGSIQSIVPLPKGAIKLTTARFFTPSGASVQGTGIVPDVLVEGAEESRSAGAADERRGSPPENDPETRVALDVVKRHASATAELTRTPSLEP